VGGGSICSWPCYATVAAGSTHKVAGAGVAGLGVEDWVVRIGCGIEGEAGRVGSNLQAFVVVSAEGTSAPGLDANPTQVDANQDDCDTTHDRREELLDGAVGQEGDGDGHQAADGGCAEDLAVPETKNKTSKTKVRL
jgi:hypothetical protein